MKVMLTGSTGFIGCHLMKAIVDSGHQISLLVRNAEKLELMKSLHGVTKDLDYVV